MDRYDMAALPPAQQRIRGRCYHPSGAFVAFAPEAENQSVPERFDRTARIYPDRVAVKSATHAVTYRQLEQAANRLAHAILRERGDRIEPVGLLFEKGVPLVIGMLGALKARKIFSPFNPSFPRARLQHILDDSHAGLLVTDRSHVALARTLTGGGCKVLELDALPEDLRLERPQLEIEPDTPASLFYTSGSTSAPKGVLDTHRGLLHFTRLLTNHFHVCARDRVTFLSSQGKNIFQALLNGATLCPFDVGRDGVRHLARWLIEQRLTVYHSTASVLRSLMGTISDGMRFPDLRLVISIGEPLYRRDVELFRQRVSPACILVNALGSAEAAHYRYLFIDGETRISGTVVPVGYPVGDKTIALLDASGRPAAAGEPGEIGVRSRHLTQGYWQRPELTDERYLRDPSDPDTRIFRTGDLGLMQPDGCLLCLGRADAQIKIGGNRIELAEIETALLALDDVEEAVVTAREGVDGEPLLVAYIVAGTSAAASVSALRRALANSLPAFMIPARFVRLDRLPKTGIGKVDLRALPPPGPARPALDAPYAAPRTPTEAALADIWAEVLGLEAVGRHDPFSELGGDSLRAGQVMARALAAFDVELEMAAFMQAATIAEMAALITRRQAACSDPQAIARALADAESLPDRR